MSVPRAGVVVLDFGRPDDAARAAASARAADLDVRVLVVENRAPAHTPSDRDHLRLCENRGFSGGMNAGLRQLLAEGCPRILLLNNDAVLEPGCLVRLNDALEDARLAAVGPVILRESDGRVESRGVSVDLSLGRVRLLGQGETPGLGAGLVPVAAVSGAAIMINRLALERVGLFDEDYFFSFEDVDWCLRARAAGFGVGVVLDARVRHGGSRTIGRAAPDRFYYAARNHARFLEKHRRSGAGTGRLAYAVAAGLNLAHALRQTESPRLRAARAVLEGVRDARRGRFGPRDAAGRSEPPDRAATIPSERP
jgi:GT2 family glycosyltransferase